LGYKAEEIIGQPVTALMPEESAHKELDAQLAVLDARGAFSKFESTRITKDGRRVPVELTGVAVTDAARTVRNYAFVIVDITARKQAEQERLKGHVLESIGFLAGGIAHDFNNLLSAVIGNIHLAKMAVQHDEKTVARLADAEQICAMAGDLTKRLLTFATGGDPVRTIMPLPPLLRDTVAAALKDTPITAQFDLPDDLPAVAIDEGQIKQVIANLVVNAKEAMSQGGTLAVRGENILVSARDSGPMREGRYVKVSLRDTGVGIPAENLARIFDPYFSTKDTYSRKGLGLGLAVCYSVIKKHDGLITVDSEAGKGTTYDIYLPAAGR
jgi:PAS domain S-box-containing protein